MVNALSGASVQNISKVHFFADDTHLSLKPLLKCKNNACIYYDYYGLKLLQKMFFRSLHYITALSFDLSFKFSIFLNIYRGLLKVASSHKYCRQG